MFNKIEEELGRKIPDALKKLSGGKWEWKPEVGERYISEDNEIHCIGDTLYLEHISYLLKTGLSKIIPLLHWEKLEEILKGIGYKVGVHEHISIFNSQKHFAIGVDKDLKQIWKWHCRGHTKLLCRVSPCKTRQEAVQRAVLALVEQK